LGSIFGQLSKRTGDRQGNGPGLALAGAAGSSPAGAGTGRGAAGGNKVKAMPVTWFSAVLAAALEIIDRDGADALSMRRLARALGRDPMIVYRRASGKAALLDGVAETVVARPAAGGRLPFPRAGAGPPARRAADRHPVAGHPPAGLRPVTCCGQSGR